VVITARPIPEEALQAAARVIKCLGHPLRLRLLETLEHGGEQNVSELQAYSGATQAAVSEQLGILRGHGIVASRRDGAYMRYRIIEPKVSRILSCVRDCETTDGRNA
jgi:DNA-binding transcriptional ArsR family regulator